jgi:hypothetical protein
MIPLEQILGPGTGTFFGGKAHEGGSSRKLYSSVALAYAPMVLE